MVQFLLTNLISQHLATHHEKPDHVMQYVKDLTYDNNRVDDRQSTAVYADALLRSLQEFVQLHHRLKTFFSRNILITDDRLQLRTLICVFLGQTAAASYRALPLLLLPFTLRPFLSV